MVPCRPTGGQAPPDEPPVNDARGRCSESGATRARLKRSRVPSSCWGARRGVGEPDCKACMRRTAVRIRREVCSPPALVSRRELVFDRRSLRVGLGFTATLWVARANDRWGDCRSLIWVRLAARPCCGMARAERPMSGRRSAGPIDEAGHGGETLNRETRRAHSGLAGRSIYHWGGRDMDHGTMRPVLVTGASRGGGVYHRMSSHLLGGSAERFTALVDGMRKK